MPHGGESLLLELFLIFVSAKLLGEIFERLSLPAVLGEMLAGVLLGPGLLKVVSPSETTVSLAALGAIFLLFTVGLEIHPKELTGVGRTALAVAAAGVTVPFVLGFGFMSLRGSSSPEALFVAAAMVATSVGITARVLRDLQALETRAARVILGAAVFDDILGMLALAVVVSRAQAGPGQWVQLGALAAVSLAFALFMLFVAPRVVRRMQPRVEGLSLRDAPLIVALGLCLGLSAAAEEIGMAAIIGAFFAGLAFAELSPEWNLQPRANALNEFLAPFFFFTLGAQLDLHVFSGRVLVTAVVLSLLAIAAKVVGCGLPVLGQGRSEALRVGVGMTPRGEVGMIVAAVGLSLKTISQEAYAVVLFMTAVTTLVAPPWLRYLFRKDARAG
ncbi:MAG TPA: cation:proton antiporter [Terriglobales bacterium]|nr:cation:proton antiporter [Terriglobales bacterium]